VHWSSFVITALVSYFIGSIPTGYLLARLKGIDIRKTGSGNIGATNVFRILGKPAGITVLLIDALKGFLPTYIVKYGIHHGGPDSAEWLAMTAGLFAILGHNYTCWLRFKGGKGIATSAGVLIALAPLALLIALGGWILIFLLSKYVSLASIGAAVILPFAVFGTGGTRRMLVLATILSLLAIYKHRANIQRLIAGTENRFGKKKEGQ
jgi:glycerol-3-phosphate acyltransferase PlsY